MSRPASKLVTQGFKKYTVQPAGIWATISGWLQVDSKRSTGIPMNRLFRNPTPAGNNPADYDDPVTVPAGDIAENQYWKRDTRRNYPQLSVVNQGDVVALLTVGSKTNPKDEVLQIGDAGAKQLVALKGEGEKGLAAFFEKDSKKAVSVLGPGGLPPMPFNLAQKAHPVRYELLPEQSYENKYPCRTFQ